MIAMIKRAGSVPVKTRLPLTAWVLAGLVTLFSMVSSLVHVTASNQALSLSEQVTVPAKEAHQASVSWYEGTRAEGRKFQAKAN